MLSSLFLWTFLCGHHQDTHLHLNDEATMSNEAKNEQCKEQQTKRVKVKEKEVEGSPELHR
jgi:hypothetical protein